MKRTIFFCYELLAILILVVAGSVSGQDASKLRESDASKLIYADFQNAQTGRPVSKNGGMTRLNQYSQNSAHPPQLRGLDKADPPAPAFARVTADDVAAPFAFEM